MALPHSAVGWSVVCDCGISWSYSHLFLAASTPNSVVVDLYADDTTFYDFQSDVFQLETYFQHALNLLHTWCRQNDMVLHTDKTKVLLITNKQNRLCLQNTVLSLKYSDIHMKNEDY